MVEVQDKPESPRVHKRAALPDRTLAQRLQALGEANRIRVKRAQLKRDLKSGQQSIYDILMDPPEWVKTMKVYDAVLACPKYGRVKTDKLLRVCKVSPARTLGGLSSRQRTEIALKMRQ